MATAEKNPSKIKGRFRGQITEKLKGSGQNRQRRRNGHGRNAEELGRLDFSENHRGDNTWPKSKTCQKFDG